MSLGCQPFQLAACMWLQDVYDKQRIPLIKSLKSDGFTWVSKYARGGSARTQSARRMYIAVDSVVGHLASNGCVAGLSPNLTSFLLFPSLTCDLSPGLASALT